MKLLPINLLAITVLLSMLSCGTVDPAQKYPNMVANVDPIPVGTAEIQINQLLSSKLVKVEAEVIFYPRLNAVALEFRYELFRHRQFWDQESRNQFSQALELYKDDYAARALVDKYRKTRAIYGKVQGMVEWEAFKYTKTRLAYPPIEIGYRFRKKTPFFTTLMRPAKVEPDAADSSRGGESSQISMFFTRAQAEELERLFDQDYLMGFLGDIHGAQSGRQNVSPDADPYLKTE